MTETKAPLEDNTPVEDSRVEDAGPDAPTGHVARLARKVGRYEPAIVAIVLIVVLTRLNGGAFLGIGGEDDDRDAVRPQIAPFAASPSGAGTVPPAPQETTAPRRPSQPPAPAASAQPGQASSPSFPAPRPGPPSAAPARPADDAFGQLGLLAVIPEPGAPTAVAVDAGGDVWVGTDNGEGRGEPGPPALFQFSADGAPLGTFSVEGVDAGVTALHGSDTGALHLLSRSPPAVHRFDPTAGTAVQVAAIPDVPPCVPPLVGSECDGNVVDQEPWPSALAVDLAGNIYVADAGQAAIWKIAAGRSVAEQWVVDLNWGSPTGPAGPSGLAFDGAGNLVVVVRATLTEDVGVVYIQEVDSDGSPGERTELARTGAASQPAGLALGMSGKAYLTLQGTGEVLVLAPDGNEEARIPSDQGETIDTPAGITFLGTAVLVASQAPTEPDGGALYRLPVGEEGAPRYG